jgi:beta-glucosidase
MTTVEADRAARGTAAAPASLATLEVDRGFVAATGIECSAPLVDGRRVDELVKTGHVERFADDFRLARGLGVEYLRYGIPFHLVNPGPGRFDWSWVDRALAACRAAGLTPIADLMHFGVPDDLRDYQNPDLPERFRLYVRAFVERYPWVRYFTPVNEPFITASFSAREGYWNEQRTDERSFVRALLHVSQCVVMGAAEIRAARPDAVLIHAETCHYTHPLVPGAIDRADLENELRFATFEMAFGRELPDVVVRHLVEHGAARDELRGIVRVGSDENWIVGNDYYATSELQIGADGRLRSSGVRLGYYELAHQYHDRLGLPVMHTETNAEGRGAEAWLESQWTDILRLRREGFPIRGFTWYGLVNHVDWDSTLTVDAGRENACGMVSLARRPNRIYRRFRELTTGSPDTAHPEGGPA